MRAAPPMRGFGRVRPAAADERPSDRAIGRSGARRGRVPPMRYWRISCNFCSASSPGGFVKPLRV